MWEDPANANGGKWILRLRKGLASRMWEKLVIAIIGDVWKKQLLKRLLQPSQLVQQNLSHIHKL